MIKWAGLSLALEDFLYEQSLRVDSEAKSSAQIVGLRGAEIRYETDGTIAGLSVRAQAERITDRYDDVIIVFGRKANGERYSQAFRASTQPGLASFGLPHYKNRGCPIMQSGQYCYRRGPHHPPRGEAYPALRQAGPVVVLRDFDQDAQPEATDVWDYPSTGINIHAGGEGERVGRWSEGCQIIWGGRRAGSPWAQFLRLIYEVAAGQTIFHYTLVDGLFFGSWYDARGKERARWRRLWFGSHGERVAALQEKLAKLGHYHSGGIDGEFGVKTHQAVRRWQAAEGKAVTGVV